LSIVLFKQKNIKIPKIIIKLDMNGEYIL